MAYLFSDGFDGHGALADIWDVADAGSSIVTDGGKYGAGTNSMVLAGVLDTNKVQYSASPASPIGGTTNPFHMAFFLKIPLTPITSRLCVVFRSTDDGSDGGGVYLTNSGVLQFGMHAANMSEGSSLSLIAGTSSLVSDNIWHHIELKFVADNTFGVAKMWVDGVLEIDFSGDTFTSGTITGIGYDHIILHSAWAANFEWDDLLVWDEEGSSMNTSTQLGVHRIETIIPDGDGTTNNFTATGAGTTNAGRVDEVGADDDTTYVESGTSTDKDLYTYSAMTSTPAIVEGVVLRTRGTNNAAGAISFKARTRSNVTEVCGTAFQLSALGVYSQYTEFVALDPDGSVAWTKTKIDAAEFGVEVV